MTKSLLTLSPQSARRLTITKQRLAGKSPRPNAAGIIETVLAFEALKTGVVPGIATLRERDPACAGIAVSEQPQAPRSGVALILCRGFAGTNAALLVRGA